MSLKHMTLWTWLVESGSKEEFRCPPGLEVTNEMFAVELAKHLQMNRLPAQVELYEVTWDDTNITQERVSVSYTGKNGNTDLVRFLFGIEQMGSFAYVERKTYIKHPSLPKVPEDKKHVPEVPPEDKPQPRHQTSGVPIFVGIALVGIALMGLIGSADTLANSHAWIDNGAVITSLVMILGGLFLIVFGLISRGRSQKEQKDWVIYRTRVAQKSNDALKWNHQVDKEQKAWDDTLNSWVQLVLRSAYLQKIDDESGRFASAVSTTVDDVVKVLFIDQNAELRNKTQYAKTQEEIEKELERRRSEAFK